MRPLLCYTTKWEKWIKHQEEIVRTLQYVSGEIPRTMPLLDIAPLTHVTQHDANLKHIAQPNHLIQHVNRNHRYQFNFLLLIELELYVYFISGQRHDFIEELIQSFEMELFEANIFRTSMGQV